MQMATSNTSMIQTFSRMMTHEGILSVYKGLGPPLSTVPFVTAYVMVHYELAKVAFGVKSEKEFTFNQSLVAGAYAGFMNTLVVTPVELVKCKLQMQKEAKVDSYYKGNIDCVRKIVSENGISGIFRGWRITAFRETFAYAGQFAGYYAFKSLIAKLLN